MFVCILVNKVDCFPFSIKTFIVYVFYAFHAEFVFSV